MAMQIPEYAIEAISKLISYSNEDTEVLLKALREARPTLRASGLVDQVISKTGKSATETADIMKALVDLASVHAARNLTPAQFSEEFVKAAEATGAAELKPPKGDWEPFKRHLVEFLNLDKSLGVVAKARDARSGHQRVFCTSRIWTDVRPIFASKLGELPAGAVCLHKLRISYHKGRSHEEFYVALDKADLLELKRQVERALQKEETIKTFFESTSIPFLGAE